MNLRLSAACAALCGCLAAAFVCVRSPEPLSVFALVAGATALCLLPLLASAEALRSKGAGLRALVVGIGLATGPLSVLARVLKITTHHRPLGAVTFAFLALFCVLGAVAFALRALLSKGLPHVLGRALFVLSLVSVLGLLVSLVRSVGARGGVVDAALALGCAALALLAPWPDKLRSSAERFGPWLWGLLVCVGFVSALSPAREAAATASPALAAVFAWF